MSVCELFGIIGALCPGVQQLGIVDDFVVSDLGQVSGSLKAPFWSVSFHKNLSRTVFTDHAAGPFIVCQDDFITCMDSIS